MPTDPDDPKFDGGDTPVRVIKAHPLRTPTALPPYDENAPEWYIHACAELGVHEHLPNGAANPRVHQYFQATRYQAGTADDAWCSSFVNWCMNRAGIAPTHGANAKSWLKWGTELRTPRLGCVAVFWRGAPQSAQGHVAFYVGETPSTISVLGGNQNNQVCVAPYPRMRLLSYRWPSGVK